VHQLTGLYPDAFNDLLQRMLPYFRKTRLVGKQRKVVNRFTPRWSLFLFLYFLRHYPSYAILAALFETSATTCWREVHQLLGPVYTTLASYAPVKLPSWATLPAGFCGAQFLVDCTSHQRKRVHPGQQLYYRGDKGFHFLTVEVITAVWGTPLRIVIARGHNNDKGTFKVCILLFYSLFPFPEIC
jgi:hypothetical protein